MNIILRPRNGTKVSIVFRGTIMPNSVLLGKRATPARVGNAFRNVNNWVLAAT
jgi:hypothetical protein